MGRAPCCDKANVKKGPWSPEEDAKLKSYIEQHGTGGNWIALPQKIGLKRCGKSCRLRWLNYLRPNIKHGGFSEEEDNIICSLYISIGSRWSIIAAQLPGRTDNDIKNYWNTRLKKKLLGKQRKEHAARRSSIASQKLKERDENNGNLDINGYINSMLSSSSDHHHQNQNPYWPELPPIPYSNEEPRFNDHASIRKLLIKLGGRFSNADDQDVQYNMNPADSIVPFYDHHQISMLPNADLPSTDQYNVNVADFGKPVNLGQGSTSSGGGFQAEMEELIYNNPQKLDGLEFLCGDNRVGNLESWSEMMSSMVLPAPVNVVDSSFESSSLHLQEDCASDDQELRYHGL